MVNLSHLESSDGGGLEPEVGLEVLGNLPDETLEGELPDEELGGLLVPPDLTESDGARAVPVGLLDSTGGRCRLPGSLGGQLLPRSLASGGLTSGLLCTGHGDWRTWTGYLEWKWVNFRYNCYVLLSQQKIA